MYGFVTCKWNSFKFILEKINVDLSFSEWSSKNQRNKIEEQKKINKISSEFWL